MCCMQLNSAMKKYFTFLTVFIIANCAFSQSDNLVFEKINLDSCTALIGVNPFFEEGIDHKGLTFYIDNKEDLRKVFQSLTYGKKLDIGMTGEELEIYVIRNKEILPIQLGVNSKLNFINIDIDEANYSFDISQLVRIAKDFPLTYKASLKKFKNDQELKAYVKKYTSDPKFICYENISNDSEGIGVISIKVESNDKPVSKGWDMIKSELKIIGAKDEDYILSYSPSFDTPGVYKYVLRTSKALFDKLTNPAFVKEKWTINQKSFEILTYWRK
jgi:hypothetical protein